MLSEKMGRVMYTVEAALEYFVSILVGGSFLATITKELGLSDSLTGILSSVISLGCLFQLIALFFRRRRVKGAVVVLSVINQLLFALLYVIPLLGISRPLKTVIFTASIVGAYLIYNVAHPHKINWLMSLVGREHRGTFTATKEVISLAGGILFSNACGWMIDNFRERGQIRTAFLLAAGTILLLTVLHTLTMVLTAEQETAPRKDIRLLPTVRNILTDRTILKITLVFVLYNIAKDVAIPFYGAYCVGELGLSLKTVTFIAMIGSLSRMAVSTLWGRYADRNSFAKMLEKCFIALALSFLVMTFALPKNGVWIYGLYTALHAVALGGINSAQINLVYDYVEEEHRADCLAVTQAVAGLVGFLTTLAVSPMVALLQNHRGWFGMQVYAQQILSFCSFAVSVLTVLYLRKVVMKIKKGV